MNTTEILHTLIRKKDLTKEHIAHFLEGVVEERIPLTHIAAILVALTMKGETTEEITNLIQGIKKHMISFSNLDAIDVCGTGGDGRSTFNISTAVAFVVAGCGVQVAKHGNRAVSSTSGSADVLEALGVTIHLSAKQAKEVLEKVGMVFLFAPTFHKAFKHVSLVRKELGIPTIFNYLGPFLNPLDTKRQLVGMPSNKIAQKLLTVSTKLDYKHLCIVVSEDGMDEVSLTAKTNVYENINGQISTFVIDPVELGFDYSSKTVLSGGSPLENAEIIQKILDGEKGPEKDIVVLNSAVALYVAGKAKHIQEGILLAATSIHSGLAKKILETLRKETQKYA